ncbi:MAG: hypothetical protein Q7K65_02075, partial [Candidatus Buchananbacteria bacterium]|nr:hypothetical protein [Candidatus Buchananbacteria bacterium]
MKDYFKPKTWLIAIIMFVMVIGLSSAVVYYEFGLNKNIKITRASAGDNVTGWAWNANTGWISFNSTDCDKNSNGFVDTNAITSGCNGNDNGTTLVRDYGAKIDLTTGHFSGYAWSTNMGWISFNRRTCVGGADAGLYCEANNDCSSISCRLDGPGATGAPSAAPYDSPASLKYDAIYSFSDKMVTGWAKILSLGDNGWIKFNGNKQDGQPWAPGVTIDPATGDFSGWAWNGGDAGSSAIGWISFNSTDCDKNGNSFVDS